MLLSVHFALEELTHSQVAARRGLRNQPTTEDITELRRLCVDLLEPIRLAVGVPVTVLSGYRSFEVNRAVGGASRSDHLHGRAADILVPGMRPFEVCRLVVRLGLPFQQAIDEFGEWTHVSIPKFAQPPKREVLTARREDGRVVYERGAT